ncbi:MAG: NADH:ubiquinone reductase (Na(+)-transporting) subunit A, partial [Bacteroidetes bacterium]|nr:NADH:ubiquinone reductase (Na(+)-transporting) subunit A [Bacteroidota bacterium]
LGANIENLVKDNLKNDHVRYISGNVLTGDKINMDDHIGFYHNLVSVIEEGDERFELLGWLIPQYPRPSLSRTFLTGWLSTLGIRELYNVNTNIHGEHRAFVVSGQYEQVLPMDIYPVHLVKAILVNDFELMENLGIYEIVEEDMALCEFVCTSKTNVQDIIRDGLDYVKSQN